MDLSWLASEAQKIHNIFQNLFYGLMLLFLLLGVFIEYFKLPLGGTPAFVQLAGRALVAAFLMMALPEIMNAVADFSDALAKDLGDLNNFSLVLHKMGERLHTFTLSWVSVKNLLILAFSFITFFLLYASVYFANAAFLWAWTLLYIFSPILIVLFIFPATSSATKGLFRTVIEVSCWKLVWAVTATLLWSFGLSDFGTPDHDINFLTAAVLNIMFAISILITPKLVRSFATGTVGEMAGHIGDMVMGAVALTPAKVTAAAVAPAMGPASAAYGKFFRAMPSPVRMMMPRPSSAQARQFVSRTSQRHKQKAEKSAQVSAPESTKSNGGQGENE